MEKLLLRLFGIKPRRNTLVPGTISHSKVPKEFDEKFKWDKDRFNNIQYV